MTGTTTRRPDVKPTLSRRALPPVPADLAPLLRIVHVGTPTGIFTTPTGAHQGGPETLRREAQRFWVARPAIAWTVPFTLTGRRRPAPEPDAVETLLARFPGPPTAAALGAPVTFRKLPRGAFTCSCGATREGTALAVLWACEHAAAYRGAHRLDAAWTWSFTLGNRP